MTAREATKVRIQEFLDDAEFEAMAATTIHKPMNSLHEGYAVLLEEVDELWDHVRAKESQRDPAAVLKELHQIAAMAARIAADVVMPQLETSGGAS